ncbi:MAG: NAD-dependent epimerase/dehydratase family protein [Actinomycetota bacterium]|nr:NAD-dependent epimerase/dehydratase family protein [Actinomycetota bacterium]
MRVLIVGASGFLGHHVVSALVGAGHRVMGTSRSGRQGLAAYQLGDPIPATVVEFGPEAVVDLAWEGIPDLGPEQCAANVAAQDVFLGHVVALAGVRRLVVTGSCREYGDAVGVATGTATPVDDFGRAKDEVHRIAAERCREAGIALAWLRVFYTYGPGQRPGSLIPTVLDALQGGVEPRVRDRSASHDFIHVSDVAAAVVAALGSGAAHDVVDLGSGESSTVGALVDLATELLAVSDPSPMSESIDPSVQPILADVDRTEAVLGWRPRVGLAMGIRHMVEARADGAARLAGGREDEPGDPG